jgi:hypothetical protein
MPPGAVDLELAHRRERVLLGVLPVDEMDLLVAALVPVGQPSTVTPSSRSFVRLLVRLHQACVRNALERADGLSEAGLVEPWLAVAQVDALEGLREVVLDQDLAEALATGDRGWSTLPVSTFQPIDASWSRNGFST